jgi:hypothetical protein
MFKQYCYQKKNNGQTLLTMYPATYLSAEHLKFGYERHYKKDFKKRMVDWFYPTLKAVRSLALDIAP